MALSVAVASRNALANLYATSFNNGYLIIYAGTAPANADAALSSNPVLATLRFPATAFGAAAAGVITAAAIAQQNAAGTGTATFYRCLASDNTTVLDQGPCGTTGTEMVLNTTSIVSGGPVAVTSFTRTILG